MWNIDNKSWMFRINKHDIQISDTVKQLKADYRSFTNYLEKYFAEIPVPELTKCGGTVYMHVERYMYINSNRA